MIIRAIEHEFMKLYFLQAAAGLLGQSPASKQPVA